MPRYATLSTAECNAVHIAREYAPDAARKAMKREIFSRAKAAFGIPATHKMVVETDVQNSGAGVLKNRETRAQCPQPDRRTDSDSASDERRDGALDRNACTERERRFGTPGDHDVRVAVADLAKRFADGYGRG